MVSGDSPPCTTIISSPNDNKGARLCSGPLLLCRRMRERPDYQPHTLAQAKGWLGAENTDKKRDRPKIRISIPPAIPNIAETREAE